MIVNFIARGRLGNAIFRYMASTILCLYYNGKYSINNNSNNSNNNCSDELFIEISENIKNGKIKDLNVSKITMSQFYQHDFIYKMNKQKIIDFIKNNQDHCVLTDGINAGDGKSEKFYMIDIINTPFHFKKKYKNVLHVRLEDFVTHNLYLKVERVIKLLEKNIISHSLCIVCKKPTTDFENAYINSIKDYVENKNIKIYLEHNDIITDYYIMKEAETLICSKKYSFMVCSFFF